MFDLFNLPDDKLDIQIFNPKGVGGTSSNWSIWQKPKNSKMVYIFAIGGGGAGGAGRNGGVGNRCGGGGGGGGAINNLFIPSFFLPNRLFINIGAGGVGGTGTGGTGGNSSIYVEPITNNSVTLCVAGGGTGGNVGTTSPGNGGGGGGGGGRSEERREGEEGDRWCRSRWGTDR